MTVTEDAAPSIFELSDLQTPWSVHVAATLDLAGQIGDRRVHFHELAASSSVDPDQLAGLVRHLISKGVFEEPEIDFFANNPVSLQLQDPGVRLAFDLDGLGGRLAGAWSGLLDLVRTGRSSYPEIFGLGFWEDLAAHPSISAQFDELMGPIGHGPPEIDILPDDNWREIKYVVDVGGGTGALLSSILLTRPSVTGTLIELAPTAARARAHFAEIGLANRADVLVGSFFEELPAGADLYILKSILNDWPDEEAEQILRRCATAAGTKGRILVIGGVGPDSGTPPMTIESVLLGARSRDLHDGEVLAKRAGLTVAATRQLPSGRFAVEFRLQVDESI